MNTVKLFARDGGFVHEAVIPPFNEPPAVIIWGERVFVLNLVPEAVPSVPIQPGEIPYFEAFTYAIPPEPQGR